jgi:hypothetical protein
MSDIVPECDDIPGVTHVAVKVFHEHQCPPRTNSRDADIKPQTFRVMQPFLQRKVHFS